jgi:hypothetical protein
MPPVVAALTPVIGAFAAEFVVTFAVSLAIGFIQQALAPRPKSPRLEVAGIDSIFFNDVEISPSDLDGAGNVVNGRFADHARIKKHLGDDSQAADSDLVAEVANWTNAHQGRGVAYIYLRLKWNRDVYPTGIPNVTAVVRGRKVWDPT